MMKRAKMLAPLLLALSLAACGAEPTAEKGSSDADAAARGIVSALGDHESFAAMLGEAGLAAAIDGPGSYTIFAPGDAALAALPTGPDISEADKRQRMTALVLAHVAPGAMTLADLNKAVSGPDGKATIRTMAGDTLTVTREEGKLVIGRDAMPPVPLDAREKGSGDDRVIGVGGTLVAG